MAEARESLRTRLAEAVKGKRNIRMEKRYYFRVEGQDKNRFILENPRDTCPKKYF